MFLFIHLVACKKLIHSTTILLVNFLFYFELQFQKLSFKILHFAQFTKQKCVLPTNYKQTRPTDLLLKHLYAYSVVPSQ